MAKKTLSVIQKTFGKIKGYITICPKCHQTTLVALYSLRKLNGEQIVKCRNPKCTFSGSMYAKEKNKNPSLNKRI